MLPKIRHKKEVYLDHAAATYLDPEVKAAMEPFWVNSFGNPSSLHKQGREAAFSIGQARESLALILSSRPEEIIFTAGGTESVNLAILGVLGRYLKGKGKKKFHIITSKIEHHSVLEPIGELEKRGATVTYLSPDKEGFIKADDLQKAIKPETVFVSIIYANNEIGSIQPIAEMGKIVRAENRRRSIKSLPKIIFHTDACQAAGACGLDVNILGVDIMSVNGGKIYGPKQSGLLFIKNETKLEPLFYGGGQERRLRSGTENVPGIIGLARALELAEENRLAESERLVRLRNDFISQVQKKVAGSLLNGPQIKIHGNLRLPNNANFYFKGIDGETLVLYLDGYGISASTGSACSTGKTDASHVLLAIGRKEKDAKSSIRFSLGRKTSKGDLNYVLKILPSLVSELRKVSARK